MVGGGISRHRRRKREQGQEAVSTASMFRMTTTSTTFVLKDSQPRTKTMKNNQYPVDAQSASLLTHKRDLVLYT